MKLNLIMVTTATKRFGWETITQLQNLKEYGLSHLAHVLVFLPHSLITKGKDKLWDEIEKNFPEVKIVYHTDVSNFERIYNSFGYIPLIRPYLLAKYFDENPHFKNEAFFYTDTDVLFTQPIDFQKYLQDDICYMSEAGSYTNSDYFDSKNRLTKDSATGLDVPEFMKPEMYVAGLKRDFLNELGTFSGINRKIIEDNKNVSGAAQYLLKNIDGDYWRDVLGNCMELKTHMDTVNREYMQSPDKGFQAWCADIHAVVWNLWRRNIKTECPKEFDFAWATDKLDKIDTCKIFHNAGVTSETIMRTTVKDEQGNAVHIDAPAFYKGAGRYVNEQTSPFDEPFTLVDIIEHPISSQYCTKWYAEQLLQVKQLYDL